MILPRRLHDERGASALVIAFSMFLLMGVTALVVDVGAGFNERRQDQSGADASTLGGAIELLFSTAADPL